MGVIYAIMNDKNDKKYFGFTSVSGEMAKCALNNKIKILNYKNATKEQLLGVSNKIIRREIMNYNHDIKWLYEIVEENVPKENLNERKRAWICEFNTDDSRFGYNICLNDRLVERNHKEHNVIQTYKTIPKIEQNEIKQLNTNGAINFNGTFSDLIDFINNLKSIVSNKEINIELKWN